MCALYVLYECVHNVLYVLYEFVHNVLYVLYDVCMLVEQNEWRGTHHYIIFGFFFLATSQVLILQVQ